MRDKTVGIYGMGRFGSFWAETLLKSGLQVVAFNRSPRNYPEGIIRGSEKDVLNCDALFFCVAISALEPLLREKGSLIGDGTLVFDTCSVKIVPMESMEKHLPRSISYIGTHPMFGPDSGRNGVAGLPLVFCPGRVDKQRASLWLDHFSSMGLKVLEISAEKHDQEAAYTQGITHFVGRILGELSLSESEIATSGYRRLLQVREQTCNDPLQLFMDLQHYNPYTHAMRLELASALEKTMALLAKADTPL
jgi:prephenate dehydrogenase